MTIKIVEGSAIRDMRHKGSGSFYSAHKQEDIEKWLSHKNADSSDYYFNEVFGDSWWDDQSHEDLNNFEVSFTETEDEHKFVSRCLPFSLSSFLGRVSYISLSIYIYIYIYLCYIR